MRVKMILPALTEAISPFFRPIKYSLFPPLGLATLAAYLRDDDEIDLQDEHVEKLKIDDTSTSSTITFLAIPSSPRCSSTACAVWGACSKVPPP